MLYESLASWDTDGVTHLSLLYLSPGINAGGKSRVGRDAVALGEMTHQLSQLEG